MTEGEKEKTQGENDKKSEKQQVFKKWASTARMDGKGESDYQGQA